MSGAYAVVGDPIDHSLSPALHSAGFDSLGISATYDRIQIPAGEFDSILSALRAGALDGINVTMPHKTAAFGQSDSHSPEARRTGSVNTIVQSDGALMGYNTDIAGVRFALGRLGETAPQRVLVLGAGGAAAAALVACAESAVYVSARSETRAETLTRQVEVNTQFVPWGSGVAGAIVVNATPIGMHGEHLPDDVVADAVALLDMTYGGSVSPAVDAMRAVGRPAVDGRSMLVGQAVDAFRLFTGRDVDPAVMLAAIGL